MKVGDQILKKTGSSTLEFIFCAPLLLIIMFVAMEVNERIEHRVTSAIATSNTAWLVDPNQSAFDQNSSTAIQDLAKSDVLGTRSSAGSNDLGIPNGASLVDGKTILSYSENKRNTDAYDAKILRKMDDSSTSTAADRSGAQIGGNRFDSVAAKLGAASASLNRVIRKVTDPNFSWVPSAFPGKDTEFHQLTWSLSTSGSTNLAISSMEKLARTVNSNLANDLSFTNDNSYRVLAHHSHFMRRYPAYHPKTDEYKNQVLLGLFLGADDPDHYGDFIDECFMKFDKNVCHQKNGFYRYINTIYMALVTAKTLIDTAGLACVAASLGTAAGACLTPTLQTAAIEIGISKLTEGVVNTALSNISSLIKNKIEEIIPKLSLNLQKEIDDEIKKFRAEVSANADTVLKEQAP